MDTSTKGQSSGQGRLPVSVGKKKMAKKSDRPNSDKRKKLSTELVKVGHISDEDTLGSSWDSEDNINLKEVRLQIERESALKELTTKPTLDLTPPVPVVTPDVSTIPMPDAPDVPLITPDVTSTAISDVPDVTPTRTLDVSEVTPISDVPDVAPMADVSDVTPAPTSDVPNMTPAPTSDVPNMTPAPTSDVPKITPAPTLDVPEVPPILEVPEVTPIPEVPDVTPIPDVPNVTPTLISNVPDVTPSPITNVPNVTSTFTLDAPDVTPTSTLTPIVTEAPAITISSDEDGHTSKETHVVTTADN